MEEGESKKAALILMKNSHFDRTLRYIWAFRNTKDLVVFLLYYYVLGICVLFCVPFCLMTLTLFERCEEPSDKMALKLVLIKTLNLLRMAASIS